MRHAFLILAHDNFRQLQRLIDALDWPECGIFVHIDRKVRQHPTLHAKNARLEMVAPRIDVRWGHVSQIEAEMSALCAAHQNGTWDYFHIISGVHYPLVSPRQFDEFFGRAARANVLMTMKVDPSQLQMRLGYRNFFMKNLVSSNRTVFKLMHILWRATLWPQKRLGITRKVNPDWPKASQWCALSGEAVDKILLHRDGIMKRMRRTFCCDEFFVPIALYESGLPVMEYDRLTFVDFYYGNAAVMHSDDFNRLKECRCLWARKFTDESSSLINRIDRELRTET